MLKDILGIILLIEMACKRSLWTAGQWLAITIASDEGLF